MHTLFPWHVTGRTTAPVVLFTALMNAVHVAIYTAVITLVVKALV